MTSQRIKAGYAKIDPAHLFDGLFVPTNGKKRDARLYVPLRDFGGTKIGFQGFDQLGADDQSILLAISAQLGIDGLMIENAPAGEISKQLRLDIFHEKTQDMGETMATKKTSLRSLLVDAGYKDVDGGKAFENAKASLNRLSNAQVREVRKNWDQRYNLISSRFNTETGDVYIAANPRLASAVFGGQHVRVSLLERAELEGEAAKILHAWLSSHVRQGERLGGGNGAHLDTLAPHVWGAAWEGFSASTKSQKRALLRDAVEQLSGVKVSKLYSGATGWAVEIEKNTVEVSRPKRLPVFEQYGLLPSDLQGKPGK